MALALAYKKGKIGDDKVSDVVKKLAKDVSEKDLEDFAKTSHKGLPDQVKEMTTLVTAQDHALDIILNDLKKKMLNDIRHNKLKFTNGVAKFVKYTIDTTGQTKGRVALVPIK
jgi:hypothetical protein